MGQMTNVLIKDDSNPLVEFTFVPVTNSRPMWRTQVAGVPVQGQMTIEQLANETLKSGDYRRVLRVRVPTMESIADSGNVAGYVASPKVAFTETITISYVSSQRSVLADRANALKVAISAICGASSTTATGTLGGDSAADAVKSGTGPFTVFFTQGEDAF